MSGVDAFLDSNVILYLLSADTEKAERAEELLAAGGIVSVQVLNEVTNVARRKLAMPWHEVFDVITQVRALCAVTSLTVETHERGIALARRLCLSVYDGMVLASALLAGCTILYTEHLQSGQVIEGRLAVRNPFVRD